MTQARDIGSLRLKLHASAGASLTMAFALISASASIAAAVTATAVVHPNTARPVSVGISGARVQHVSGDVLSAPAMDARNTFGDPQAVHPMPLAGAELRGGSLMLTLPAKSVVVVNLE